MRLLCLTFALAAATFAGDLLNVRNVYILPMQSGLDQYMANRLTEKRFWVVVTDPSLADAVVTDHIGEGFEEQLDELYPEESKKAKSEKEDENAWVSKRPRSASFSRGRGTVFLVDRKTRDVVWSIYSPSGGTRPDDLNRNAGQIVKKMEESIRPKSNVKN